LIIYILHVDRLAGQLERLGCQAMNLPRKLGCKELALGLALLLPGVIPRLGQLNATLSGTVSDETGAIIPGASVTATEISTGIAATVPSNDAGSYSFLALPPERQVTDALRDNQDFAQTHYNLGLIFQESKEND